MKTNFKKACPAKPVERSRGFTLIELLVVVAIIGILASVVLASLNGARNKGANAAIKADLSNMRSQAALYYDDNFTYGSDVVCTADPETGMDAGCTGLFSDEQMIAAMMAAATTSGGVVTSNTDSTGEKWAAYANLKDAGSGETTFCVDGEGNAKSNSTATDGICS